MVLIVVSLETNPTAKDLWISILKYRHAVFYSKGVYIFLPILIFSGKLCLDKIHVKLHVQLSFSSLLFIYILISNV